MTQISKWIFTLLILINIPFTINTWAEEDPIKLGTSIATKSAENFDHFTDSVATGVMLLKDKGANSSIRKLTIKTLEVDGDGDKALIRFETPRSVAGTTFLSFSHKNAPDEQWIYLPIVKRVKRIAPTQRHGSFMGSEFSYEDLSSQEVENYNFKFLGEETCQKSKCSLIERTPKLEDSHFTKNKIWYEKNHTLVTKVEYYDRNNNLIKTLTIGSYKKYLNKHWRPGLMVMKNHATGKETELKLEKYQFKTGLSSRIFHRSSLKGL